ncbi:MULTISPECIES: chromate transporter [unclassified Bradyrhizobium]|uniref:chromate transporter n=1 Tax=unclassified Bradyrhizobium TaxID=2631580 RepID=UPI0028E813C7|nr:MULTISPECIES: chromate transporter [unclassified Bradyrhizobium]
MNVVQLYLLLLKGTITAFAGLASLPVIQESLVNHYHVLTNEQLNSAVVITRGTPGPVGLWVVSAGYFAAGVPGAIAGWLAMITPALLIVPLVHFVGRKLENPRIRAVMQAVVITSAGLLLAAAIPLGKDALTGPATITIAVTTIVLMLVTKLDTLWIILGSAVITLTLSSIGLVQAI